MVVEERGCWSGTSVRGSKESSDKAEQSKTESSDEAEQSERESSDAAEQSEWTRRLRLIETCSDGDRLASQEFANFHDAFAGGLNSLDPQVAFARGDY